MRTAFDDELTELNRLFSQLGRLTNEAIYKSIKAFVNHDKQLAQTVIEEDYRINDLERDIDVFCNELIALQAPNSKDLRLIITILKASSDLERMGDHAVSISVSTIRVKGTKRNEDIEALISKTGEKIKVMGQEIIEAFLDFDLEAARDIAMRDDEIDHLTSKIRHYSVSEMMKDQEAVASSTDYSFVSMYIERIGDYITNIAEALLYLETGEIKDLN